MESMGEDVDPAQSDCVSCHMYPARTEDVIKVIATDHYIRRHPPERDLTAPLKEMDPEIPTKVIPYFKDRAPAEPELSLYTSTPFGMMTTEKGVTGWWEAIKAARPKNPQPRVMLAQTFLRGRNFEGGATVIAPIVRKHPDGARSLK